MVGELAQQLPVEIALERHDEIRKLTGLNPLPLAKFGMFGVDVDVAVGPEKAGEEPVLVLALELPAP
jgi:hypothetical protein